MIRRFVAVAATAAIMTATLGSQDTSRVSDTSRAVPDSTAPRSSGPIRLIADVSSRSLRIVRGDETIKSYAVAVGSAKYPTPRGNYRIRKVVWNPSWRPPDSDWAKNKTPKEPGAKGNPMKLVKIFFREPDFYIHGTDDVESLGSAASHGCIRMDPSEAADVARIVMEAGGAPRDESWFSRVIHLRWQTHVVNLKDPIPITIAD